MTDDIDEQSTNDDGGWADRIAAAEKESDFWWERCKKIKQIYKDKRDGSVNASDNKRFNILWSNIQTTSPVLYARLPIPVVMAKDFVKDPGANVIATALKRTLTSELKEYDFDGKIKETVLDYQLTARGTVWIAYEPYFKQVLDDATGEPVDQKDDEHVYCIFVNYKDFLTNKARTWAEVTWVARRIELTRKEAKESFPEVEFAFGEKERICVWEVWDKTSGDQIFIAPDNVKKIIKRGKAPIDFDNFFPCPKPLYSNLDNETIIPTPDYTMYQDQAGDLNKYTNRLSRIGDALKVRGVYNSVNTSLQTLFEENQENILVPVSTPIDGGNKPFDFVPLDIFVQAASETANLKNMVKQDIYELTGISDIVRGASDPNETATAQNIKNQWGALRVKEKQKDVQRFIRDVLRLKSEVIAEHFDLTTIEKASGIQIPPDLEPMLRDGLMRNFIIDVETDSTLEPDAQQEKQDRTEFLNSLAQYLETALKIGQEAPQLAPMLSELVMFGMKAFPVGTDMENTIKEALNQMVQAKQEAAKQPPPPDPEMVKIEQEGKKAQAEIGIKTQEMNQDAVIAQGDYAIKVRELDLKERDLALREQELQNSKELEHKRIDSDVTKARLTAKSSASPEAAMTDHELQEDGVAPLETMLLKFGETMMQGFEHIAQSQAAGNAAVIQAVTAPRTTHIVRDQEGRISEGVSTVQ